MFKLNDQPLALDTAFTHNEIQYPANWLRLASPEERAAIGITEVDDPVAYDDRFYWGIDNPKDLSDLKSNWSAQTKDTTNKLLAATDWMVIRKAERDVAIPESTATYRASVLTECDRLLAAIDGADDVEALIAVLSNQEWPEA
jgi:hypothetical protein